MKNQEANTSQKKNASWGFPRFLAARLSGVEAREGWSRPVVQIATAGVVLGIALIIVSSAIVHGFQREVRALVVGFGSHVQVLSRDADNPSILRDVVTEDAIMGLDAVQSMHPFYTLPGILEAGDEWQGIIAKGFGAGANASMVESNLTQGALTGADGKEGLVLSEVIASQMNVGLSDQVTVYLVNGTSGIRPRVFQVCGLYDTGLLEYDEDFIFLPSAQIQEVAGWGLEAQIRILDNQKVEALVFGAHQQANFQWRMRRADSNDFEVLPWRGAGPHELQIIPEDAHVECVVKEVGKAISRTGDTVRVWHDSDGWQAQSAGGGWRFHASGYEIVLEDENMLWEADEAIYRVIPMAWKTETVVEQAPEMYTWLGMLDLNVEIIIGLMVLISIINMTSALLILILERRAMVGMLKALGMADGAVLKVFFWQALRILGRGFVWGNVLGCVLVWIQWKTGWVRLDPEAYYLSVVPVYMDWLYLFTVEAIAFGVCSLMMWLPAMASMRIMPAEALRLK